MTWFIGSRLLILTVFTLLEAVITRGGGRVGDGRWTLKRRRSATAVIINTVFFYMKSLAKTSTYYRTTSREKNSLLSDVFAEGNTRQVPKMSGSSSSLEVSCSHSLEGGQVFPLKVQSSSNSNTT